ncbi:MAG: Bax inhibitor-1/YccA family protein [Propioniciclava sp.]
MPNPILARSEKFRPHGYITMPGQPPQQGYGAPQHGAPPQQGYGAPGPVGQQPGVMTLDDVITKTAITMGVLFLTAAITFMFLPVALVGITAVGAAIAGFVTVMLVAFRRQINPAMVMVYSVIEGIFIGAFSKFFEIMFPGIVVQAVFATFIAAGATLFAYKFFNIKVTTKFRRIVTYSTFAFMGLVLINFVLALLGIDLGIRSVGGGPNWLAVLVSLVAVVLAVANLVMDFDYVEQGIRNRLPAVESWRAAFGLTVTMVWLYTEILRILSYFRSN